MIMRNKRRYGSLVVNRRIWIHFKFISIILLRLTWTRVHVNFMIWWFGAIVLVIALLSELVFFDILCIKYLKTWQIIWRVQRMAKATYETFGQIFCVGFRCYPKMWTPETLWVLFLHRAISVHFTSLLITYKKTFSIKFLPKEDSRTNQNIYRMAWGTIWTFMKCTQRTLRQTEQQLIMDYIKWRLM